MKKRPPFLRLTECNIPLLSVLPWNNCVRYVENQQVSMYMGAYVTKHCTESQESLSDTIAALERHYKKIKDATLLAEVNTIF